MRSDILKRLEQETAADYEKVAARMRAAAGIADAMTDAGVSAAELARLMKKSPSEVSKWLSGTHNITIDTISEISLTLGIEIRIGRDIETKYPVNNSYYSNHSGIEKRQYPVIVRIPSRNRHLPSLQYSYSVV